jgi:cytochrome c-type biogenesis protein
LAASSQNAAAGVIMLFTYSMGLGIPFVLSALLLNQLKQSFDFIKKHYKAVNLISGEFLVLVGVLMMSGVLGGLLHSLSS